MGQKIIYEALTALNGNASVSEIKAWLLVNYPGSAYPDYVSTSLGRLVKWGTVTKGLDRRWRITGAL